MSLMFYSMSLNSLVVSNIIESGSLPYSMKVTDTETLYVKGQIIEQTRSYSTTNKMALTAGGNLYSLGFIETNAGFCLVIPLTASYGGGNTFDCYYSSSNVTSLPQGGTGIGALAMGDGNEGAIYGDSFNGYNAQSPITSPITGSALDGWHFG